MPVLPIPGPGADEYDPYYAGYIARMANGDVIEALVRQIDEAAATLSRVKPADEGYRYAPGKWTVREVVGHLADTERIMSYRLLRIARADPTPLPGFDENAYVAAAGADSRRLSDLVAEFRSVRTATLSLIRGLDAETLGRRGMANGKPVSARALVHIIGGHERHHMAVLGERYAAAFQAAR
jgi:hypothetical protein